MPGRCVKGRDSKIEPNRIITKKPVIKYLLGGRGLFFAVLMMRASVSWGRDVFNPPHCLIIILIIKREILKIKI